MPLSPLELLPAEILQEIFLLSPNLDLPLASPHIASKLSTPHCYHAVCNHFLTSNLNDRPRQTRLQSRIFALRWMTWSFFQSHVTKTYARAGCLCGESGCAVPIWPPDFTNPLAMSANMGHLPQLSYIKCRIPAKLLHGPWTADKVQFLRFLVSTTSMTVDWADRSIRQLTLQGKKDAILSRNYDAVDLFNHNRRLGKPPTMEMVRFAVIEGGCDRTIVYDIMATARMWGYRYWEDSALDEWVQKAVEEGNPKGPWLRLKLKELRMMNGYMGVYTGDYTRDGDVLDVRHHRGSRLFIENDSASYSFALRFNTFGLESGGISS